MTAYQQVVAAWNAQADETNQWDNLGEDEKIEWALKCADQLRSAMKMIQAVRQKPTRKGNFDMSRRKRTRRDKREPIPDFDDGQ